MKRLFVLFVFAATVAGSLPALARTGMPPGQVGRQCRDKHDAAKELRVPVGDDVATGRYALPAGEATTLVVFAHGYGHDSRSWVDHMRRAAADHGVISVAMDYRGTHEEKAEDGTTTIRGWFVKEGAEDLVAAAQHFQSLCPSIEQTVLFGVSMGGNASGLALALASEERSARGGALFDYWFDVEGAVNVVETYAGAAALAPANAFAAAAKEDIEAEVGGTPADDPEGYADLAVVSHLDEIAASGVKGVAVVHALEDGLVPYNQSREIVAGLAENGIPVDSYTIAGKGEGESGTTISGYSPIKDSPFAGHASETSTTHIVMVTALDRLWALVDDEVVFEDYTENLVDGF